MFLDYELPSELIAQHPAEPRDAARLLVVRRDSNAVEHRHVRDLPELLAPNDLLVINDTRVLPARLLGRRSKTGGKWEGLYLGTSADGCWEMLSQTRGILDVGEQVDVEPGPLSLTLIERPPGRPWKFQPDPYGDAVTLLGRHGHVPLPPYIRKGRDEPSDREHYQTVFANAPGSVAAPTAGLHFTPELLQRLEGKGVRRANVTLHVGLGTFQPLKDSDPERHVMHKEWCTVPATTVAAVQQIKVRGGRVVAVGSTSARTLETASQSGTLNAWSGETDLFIRPPYTFRTVDCLMTNFHLPQTTLLLMVSAFAGEDLTRQAYETAIAERYRFFSYGDAMLIV
ncbi:MAG: tRNA preQ1(34) S-adenosylmethionine ribosyltransferase-isomerase QueA [Gemmataceae bacterium]